MSEIVEFFEHAGHNLMVFADIDARRHVRKIANNFGVDFEPYVSGTPQSYLNVALRAGQQQPR